MDEFIKSEIAISAGIVSAILVALFAFPVVFWALREWWNWWLL